MDASPRAVEADAGGTVVNTGIIRSASSDGLYLGDASTVTNSGTISGSALAINFANSATNTLTLDTGSVLNGNVQGGGGINNLTLIGTGTESIAKFLNFQTLSMQGAAWTLTGNGTFSTSATIQSGTLLVNGRLTSPVVMVQSGGTLGGIGTIVGPTTVASGGALAPGSSSNPTGTLTITGNLAFQSGAIYLVQVTPSTADSTNVSGTATLTGATVNAQVASGNYVSKKYTILSAAGGLGGTTFAGIANINLPQGASDSLSYDANNVYLNLKAGFTNYTGLNVNQQNVANALTNFFNTTGGIPAAFFGLSPGGLTQIDGEAGTGAERAAIQLTNQFLTLMLDPFVNGRANVGAGGAIGFAPEQEASLPPDVALAYASILNKAPPKPIFDQRWTAWGSGFGGSNTTNGDAVVGSNNVRVSTFGFAGGMDYHLSPTTVVGFALAGAGTNWGLANALGSGRSDAFQAGAYGISWFGLAYLAGALAFTNHWFSTSRSALGDSLSANFVGQSYGARLESGYRLAALPTLGVTPYGAVQVQDFHTPAYSESGSDRRRLWALLQCDERDRRAHRTRQPLRRADAALRQAAGALRPRRLGARLCQQSGAGRCVSGAAGRKLRRQRRADPARLGADHGRRRIVHHAQLDVSCQVRGRVRSWLADLCWLGYAALFVVGSVAKAARPDGPALRARVPGPSATAAPAMENPQGIM